MVAVGQEAKRAKTARARRALARRDPKLVENPRTALVVRGQKTSGVVNSALTDLFMLKKPYAVHFKRHNAVHPFEDVTPLEFLCQKNDASIFAFGTHSKKRPQNLVVGRMYDHHLLDMVELAIDSFHPIAEFAGINGGCAAESKPCLLFEGDEWEHSADLQAVRSIFIDFFQLRVVDTISAIGIEHVLCFSAMGSRILLRHYIVQLRKSAEGTAPHVQLSEMGPSFDFSLRRMQHAAPDLMKAAMTKPAAMPSQPKKIKNIERSALHGRQGRLHVPKQDLTQLATARMKGLKKRPSSDGGDDGSRRKKPRVGASGE